MGIRVHRFTRDEGAAFQQMMGLMARAFQNEDHYLSRPPGDDYLKRLLAKPDFIALGAWAGDQLAGSLVAYELVKFEQERSEIYIYDLAVDEQHRRQGVATALIEELKVIARACGAWVIFVQADQDEDDQPAIALYTKLGTREEVLHFDIEV